MFKRTTRNQETEEEVMFKCLHCGKDKLKGKRNKETGQLHPSGILRHIKQKTKAGKNNTWHTMISSGYRLILMILIFRPP